MGDVETQEIGERIRLKLDFFGLVKHSDHPVLLCIAILSKKTY